MYFLTSSPDIPIPLVNDVKLFPFFVNLHLQAGRIDISLVLSYGSEVLQFESASVAFEISSLRNIS